MIAATVCQRDSPKNSGPMMPTATVANSRLGEVHVQSSWIGRPWRSLSGMISTPPGSMAMVWLP